MDFLDLTGKSMVNPMVNLGKSMVFLDLVDFYWENFVVGECCLQFFE